MMGNTRVAKSLPAPFFESDFIDKVVDLRAKVI